MDTIQNSYREYFASDFSTWTAEKIQAIKPDASITEISKGYIVPFRYGRTTAWGERPKPYLVEIGPEWNRIEILCSMCCVTAGAMAFRIYGYTKGGPAEIIADISVIAGSAVMATDNTAVKWAGGMTQQVHYSLMDPSASPALCLPIGSDNSDRIAKLIFSNPGYRYIFIDPYEVTQTQEKTIQFWLRGF